MSHTPEPWTARFHVVAAANTEYAIFKTFPNEDGGVEFGQPFAFVNTESNASLIAAAPELLLMLKEWLQCGIIDPRDDERAKRSFALIARATGGGK